MTDIPKSADGIAFLDNPHAPDFFADDAMGFFVNEGVLRATFISARVNHATSPGPVTRVVIGRLVMSEAGMERFARGVLQMIENRRKGVTPTDQAPPTTLQ